MSEEANSENFEDRDDDVEQQAAPEVDISEDNSSQSQINLKTIKVIELRKYKEKDHFFSKNLQKDCEIVKMKDYPKNELLDSLYEQYTKIKQLKPSQEEVFLKINDQAYQQQKHISISEVQELQKERDDQYYNYLLKIRKNFVNEELFCKLTKKVKLQVLNDANNDANNKIDQEDSNQQQSQASNDVFSNYSEFY